MPWPTPARAAVTLTFDNMGEAADLNRGLHPAAQPIGAHYSVTRMLPQFLALAVKYALRVTYFVESWNLGVYPDAVRAVAAAGHEVGWHAWQHEAWGVECEEEGVEKRNFERSFEAMRQFVGQEGGDETGQKLGGTVEMYSGFRPPGGVIHGARTLRMCREFGLTYISPAAEHGALVPLPATHPGGPDDAIAVLPFRWRTVDAYYYMPAFSKLRERKGTLSSAPQPPAVLVDAFKREIDDAIATGGFVSLLFHPFLNDAPERLQAMEQVLAYLARRRDEGAIWLAPARELAAYVRANPDVLGAEPEWDDSTWR